MKKAGFIVNGGISGVAKCYFLACSALIYNEGGGGKPQRNINSRDGIENALSTFDIAIPNPQVFNLIRCLYIFITARCFSLLGGAMLLSRVSAVANTFLSLSLCRSLIYGPIHNI